MNDIENVHMPPHSARPVALTAPIEVPTIGDLNPVVPAGGRKASSYNKARLLCFDLRRRLDYTETYNAKPA